MAMLVDGTILCALSPAPIANEHFPRPTTFYEFDYLSNTFRAIAAPGGGASIDDPSYVFCFLALPDGTVFCTRQASASYYVYLPDGAPLEMARPVVGAVEKLDASKYRVSGTGFNGISEGASYGDDWQMNTNQPIARLTSQDGKQVRYARTFGWNSTGVATGLAPTSTRVALASSIGPGSYWLEVVANGIASETVPFVVPATPCDADLNADGVVGPADLSMLLGQWNGIGAADLDASGTVDAADIDMLLGAWGMCP